MEPDGSDLQDYWNEYKSLQETTKLLDDYLDEAEDFATKSYEAWEQETEWLTAAGLDQLTEAYHAGREVSESEVGPAVNHLPRHQAEAVRRRVRSLNLTVRQRGIRSSATKNRKPDIRDVFRDVEVSSTGTHSRSATPDSLDSEPAIEENSPSPPNPWTLSGSSLYEPQKFSDDNQFYSKESYQHYKNGSSKEDLRRLTSAAVTSHNDLFKRSGGWIGNKHINFNSDVASDSEGITILGYHPIGSMHIFRPRERGKILGEDGMFNNKEFSDENKLQPFVPVSSGEKQKEPKSKYPHVSISRSHSNLYNIDLRYNKQDDEMNLSSSLKEPTNIQRSISQGHLYRSIPCNPSNEDQVVPNNDGELITPQVGQTCVDFLGEEDIKKLRHLILLEVTSIFDTNGIQFRKHKPPKRKKKEGILFGMSLAALMEKDRLITSEKCDVPLVFQKLLYHLVQNGLQEEGLLRVPGHSQKVEILQQELEKVFYENPAQVDHLLQQVSSHDIACILKRFLRDLPQPLLTAELLEMFYLSHALPNQFLQEKALNLLILLLPSEHWNVLKELIKFLLNIVRNESFNKMSLHNVSMIIAPSLFPLRYVQQSDKNDVKSQVHTATVCCQLTELILKMAPSLGIVPNELVIQVRKMNEEKKMKKENHKPMKRFLKKSSIHEPVLTKLEIEKDFNKRMISVSAQQFEFMDFAVQLNETTTAGDVVVSIFDEGMKQYDALLNITKIPKRSYYDMKLRAMAEIAPNQNLSCLITMGSKETILRTHYLYEVGGNIAQRQIEQTAILLDIFRENPNTQWVLRCHHRHGVNGSKQLI